MANVTRQTNSETLLISITTDDEIARAQLTLPVGLTIIVKEPITISKVTAHLANFNLNKNILDSQENMILTNANNQQDHGFELIAGPFVIDTGQSKNISFNIDISKLQHKLQLSRKASIKLLMGILQFFSSTSDSTYMSGKPDFIVYVLIDLSDGSHLSSDAVRVKFL